MPRVSSRLKCRVDQYSGGIPEDVVNIGFVIGHTDIPHLRALHHLVTHSAISFQSVKSILVCDRLLLITRSDQWSRSVYNLDLAISPITCECSVEQNRHELPECREPPECPLREHDSRPGR